MADISTRAVQTTAIQTRPVAMRSLVGANPLHLKQRDDAFILDRAGANIALRG